MSQICQTDENLILSKEAHKEFRSGVGMLLWLVKHSRPDIANSVRELSKVLDGPTKAAQKEMLRGIKYVLDTKDRGLKLLPKKVNRKEPWELVCFSDSDYAGDPDSRRSVSGYVLFAMGVPIVWRSQGQKSVTLSSSEAEWIAMSEAVKDIMFLVQLLQSMSIPVRLPVTVRVDNIGAIFMAKNASTTGRTKHVDVRTKFVREFQEDGKITIIFVKSEDNHANILTKNITGDLQDKHAGVLTCRKGDNF